ncbi:hypothetical protein ACGLWX_05855 [Halomonas sp. HMF6819]|uniref:hypothetical protein n=1 Tax=Halomonas sp. HMF6819 TaxID=3373085 RepID=UPI0037B7DF06
MSRTEHIRLVLDNAYDAASLAVNQAAPGTPIENTQRDDRAEVYRSADTSTIIIEGTLAAGAFVDNLYILRHNLSATGTIRLVLLDASGEPWESGQRPTGEIIPAGVWRAGIDAFGATYNDKLRDPVAMMEFPITAITGFRLEINDPGNADGAIDIGRVVLGLAFVAEFNASYDLIVDWPDRAQHEYSAGQTLRTINGGNPRRQTTFNLDWLYTADRARLLEELAQRGMIADVFVDLYPASTGIERLTGAFLGRMTEGYSDAHYMPRVRKTTLSFIEV